VTARAGSSAPVDEGSRLLRALLCDEPWGDLAAASGADPDGPFCAAVTRVRDGHVRVPQGVWTVSLGTASATWLLAQVDDPAALAPVLPAPAGVGAVRVGWDGARQSLVDARLALGVSRDAVGTFDEEWVLATLYGSRERLTEVCAPGQDVARKSRHLADAVEAFADNRLSVVGAARALHVHPNTVIYRLERWHGLTGWDPRTFRGLAASVACLRVAR
jgi:hypothetical protein